jgi:hypothetical protein
MAVQQHSILALAIVGFNLLYFDAAIYLVAA